MRVCVRASVRACVCAHARVGTCMCADRRVGGHAGVRVCMRACVVFISVPTKPRPPLGPGAALIPAAKGGSPNSVRIWPKRAGSAARPRGSTPAHTLRREPSVTQRPSYNARPPAGPLQRGLGTFSTTPPIWPHLAQNRPSRGHILRPAY